MEPKRKQLTMTADEKLSMMSEESISEVDVPHDEFLGSTFLVDDGGGIRIAYLVQLSDSETGEYHAIELQNAETDDGELGMEYYQTQPAMDLDDEQASAAANLLEFNQQVYILPDQQMESEAGIKMETLSEHEPEPVVPEPILEPLVPPPVIIHTPIMTNPKITKTYGGGKSAGVKKPSTSQSQPPKAALMLPPSVVPSVSKSKVDNGPFSNPGPAKSPIPILTPFRRKRKLILDTTKVIPNAEFRKQLKEPVFMGSVALAPPTKKAMLKMSFTGVGKFFASPGRPINSLGLSQLFLSNLKIRAEIPTIPIPDSRGMLEPLDPELQTADSSSEFNGGFVSSYMTYMSRQKAEYFDALVKGMGKSRSTTPKIKKPSFLSTITRDRFISPKIEYLDTPSPRTMMVIKQERTRQDPLLIHTENGTVETDTEFNPLTSSTNVQLQSEDGELIISDLQPANGEYLYTESCSEEPSETETVYYLNGDTEQVDEGSGLVVSDVKSFQPTLYLE